MPNIDWSQFVPSLIATFCGCALAIFLTSKYESRKYKKNQTEILRSILEELIKVENQIKSIHDKIENENRIYLSPLKTPVYESLIHSQKIESLIEALKGRNVGENQEGESILLLYEYIDEYNAWHSWRTISSREEDQRSATETIKELEKVILELVARYKAEIEEAIKDGAHRRKTKQK